MPLGSHQRLVTLLLILLSSSGGLCLAQSADKAATPGSSAQASDSANTEALKRDFFAAIREGNAERFLSYISKEGVGVGSQVQRETREEVEQQILHRRGLYCELFDSSCIDRTITLDASRRACSYREALHAQDVHLAATQTVRNGVRQAILVARINDRQCPDTKLIDFIFNYQSDGWKLFSIP